MVKKIKTFLMLNIFPPLIFLFLKFLRMTSKIVHVGREEVYSEWQKRNMIMCFWHGRLLMMPYAYEKKMGKVLISRHRDGEMIARVVRYFKVGTIRGSFRKGSVRATKEMLRALREGYDLAIAADGPKGPKYTVKRGTVELARLSETPIVPVTFSASKKKLLSPGTNLSFRYHSRG